MSTEGQELFVKYLATYSYKHGIGKQKKELTYDDLSKTAEVSDTFQFLADILPKKISIAEYLKLLKREEENLDQAEVVNEVEIDVDDDSKEEEEDEEEDGEEEDEDDDDDDEEYVQEIEDDDEDDDSEA